MEEMEDMILALVGAMKVRPIPWESISIRKTCELVNGTSVVKLF